jgi:hypothetical protein
MPTLTPEFRAHFVRLLRSQVGPITKARTFVALAEDAGIRLGTPGRQSGKTATVAGFAKSLNPRLNPRTVRGWLRALRVLPAHPDLLALVEAEELSIKAALRIAGAREKDAANTATDEQMAHAAATWRVEHADFRDLLPTLRGTVDLLLTDPPYAEEWLWNWDDLGRHVRSALAPGGIAAVMCDQRYLNRIMAALDRHLVYEWTCDYLCWGRDFRWAPCGQSLWKPILLYTADGHLARRFGDTFVDGADADVFLSGGKDKRYHPHGQDVPGHCELVRQLCPPPGLVCDCCCGGGTTGEAAVIEGRRVVLGDIEATAARISRGRLARLTGREVGGDGEPLAVEARRA